MLSLHPDYKEAWGDPKRYLDGLQDRMDNLSAEAPEMSVRLWGRARTQHGFSQPLTEDGGLAENSASDSTATHMQAPE